MFFNVHDNSFLNFFTPGPSKHPVFARVVDGYPVVESISRVQTVQDNPVTPIRVQQVVLKGI